MKASLPKKYKLNIKLWMTLVGFCLFHVSSGQNVEEYFELKKEAEKLYNSKEYHKSAKKYEAAFDLAGEKIPPRDRYNAACSYALAKNTAMAFHHLFFLANNANYKNEKHLKKGADLKLLHQDKRWKELAKLVKSNQEEAEKKLDKDLVAQLKIIHHKDQKYRREINKIIKKHGWKSEQTKAHWKIIQQQDSINLIQIEKILAERGWLGADTIGSQGNGTLFLVIQHADIATQLKYLPMMRAAVKIGNARGSDLALLEDRVALRQGKKQIYGSQIHTDKEGNKFVAPLIDPKNVDKRRATVGLQPIAGYIAHWNMTWDVEKHLQRIAIMEAEKNLGR